MTAQEPASLEDFFRPLLLDEGTGVGFHVSIRSLVDASSSLVERWGAASQPLLGELGQPALHHVDPRAVGGSEAQVEAGWRRSERRISGAWWVHTWPTTRWTSRSSGTVPLMRSKNRRKDLGRLVDA